MTDNPTPNSACVRCGHPAPDHGPRGCTGTAGSRCGCPRDAAGAAAYWPLVDPGAARWVEHGTTWTRDEYGNTHSLGPATAPGTEPGTPDDARQQLRQDIALALARADRTGALDAPEDRWHEYTTEADAVLAVRDDTLITTQTRLRKAERAANLLADAHRRAEAAEQRITAALTHHYEVDGSPDSEGSCIQCGQDYPCATRTALTPRDGQDGGTS